MFCWLIFQAGIPDRTESVSAAPVSPSLKSKPTQRRAEFARMTFVSTATPQSRLQGRNPTRL